MAFIRPELRARLWLWREVIFCAGLAAAGLWALASGGFLLRIIGGLVVVLAAGLGVLAHRRLRFGLGNADGPGIVQVDEWRIRYFGPFYGGAVSLPALSRIEMRRTADGKRLWHLHHDDGPALVIPAAARDADRLFDAFAVLPGLNSAKLVQAGGSLTGDSVTIWQRPGAGDLTRLASRRTPSPPEYFN